MITAHINACDWWQIIGQLLGWTLLTFSIVTGELSTVLRYIWSHNIVHQFEETKLLLGTKLL